MAKLYPDAHEASIFFRGAHDGGAISRSGTGEGGPGSDPLENRSRAERRARSKVRLYAKANGVDRLMTLTYAPPFCTDPVRAYLDVCSFIRRLRHFLGKAFPYVWVLELHKDGERLHVHLGLAQYVEKAVLARLWPHGFVDIRRIRTKAGDGPGARASMAAHYLAKYVGKAFESFGAGEAGAGCGRHRYEVGQGFQPRSTGLVFASESEARAWLIAQEGGELPGFEWSSDDIDGWAGPPTRGLRW